jgi:hypothetical protein
LKESGRLMSASLLCLCEWNWPHDDEFHRPAQKKFALSVFIRW